MDTMTLTDALATTWEPEADQATVEAWDVMMGDTEAANICKRLAAVGEIMEIRDDGWKYEGRAKVGQAGKGYDAIPFMHDTYRRVLWITACLMQGDEIVNMAVRIQVYRYGKGGQVRRFNDTAADMVGVLIGNARNWDFESSVKKALALKALGVAA